MSSHTLYDFTMMINRRYSTAPRSVFENPNCAFWDSRLGDDHVSGDSIVARDTVQDRISTAVLYCPKCADQEK